MTREAALTATLPDMRAAVEAERLRVLFGRYRGLTTSGQLLPALAPKRSRRKKDVES
jgi:hypothetical protein